MKVFESAEATNTSSATFAPTLEFLGECTFFAFGTIGGATMKLQQSPDGGTTWFDLASVTAAGATDVKVRQNTLLRTNITGGTAASITLMLSPAS